MSDVHYLNPDSLAAELAWRHQSLSDSASRSRGGRVFTLPRWRSHPSSRSRVVRRGR